MTLKDEFRESPETVRLNTHNSDGLTPIQQAIMEGDADKVKSLAENPDVQVNKLSADGKATMFYIREFQRTHGGTNHYTGQSPATAESERIDGLARRMTEALKIKAPQLEFTTYGVPFKSEF